MPLLGSAWRVGKTNFPLGHLTPQELQSKPRMTPSDLHEDERSPGVRKRKSWEAGQGWITAGRHWLRVCCQTLGAGAQETLGKGELWDLGQCRLTSLLGSVFGLG